MGRRGSAEAAASYLELADFTVSIRSSRPHTLAAGGMNCFQTLSFSLLQNQPRVSQVQTAQGMRVGWSVKAAHRTPVLGLKDVAREPL